MSLRRLDFRSDRGAAALFIATGMVLFLGMAALAIDVGLGFNERRQDQSAADSGVMAGALEAVNAPPAMVTEAIDYVRSNLDQTFTNAEWQAAWEGCVDPAAVRNDGGFNFVALTPPVGWTAVDAANWCVSIDASEFLFRVRVPDQIIDTTFGRVLGVDELRTHAAAVAKLTVGGGGVLPFGLPAGAGGGGIVCLSSGPPPLALDPCTVTSGNFGTVQLLKFGNSVIPTNENCPPQNPNTLLAQNIAHGADHIVFRDSDGLDANMNQDMCYSPEVDSLFTDTGFPNNSLEQGLVGPVPPDGAIIYNPRLDQSGPTSSKFGFDINRVPLWTFLNDTTTVYGSNPLVHDAPLICDPSTFDGGMFDWDGDGVDDPNRSWQHMADCIDHYLSGNFQGVFFNEDIQMNVSRFGYVPEFWDVLGPGAAWEHIRYFRPVYLQGLLWKGNGPAPTDYVLSNPGEQCYDAENNVPIASCDPPGNWGIIQLSAFAIPDRALPESIRGSSLAGSDGVNPFTPELFR